MFQFLLHSLEVNGNQYCLVTNICQNILFCALTGMEHHDRMLIFLVYYAFKELWTTSL